MVPMVILTTDIILVYRLKLVMQVYLTVLPAITMWLVALGFEAFVCIPVYAVVCVCGCKHVLPIDCITSHVR